MHLNESLLAERHPLLCKFPLILNSAGSTRSLRSRPLVSWPTLNTGRQNQAQFPPSNCFWLVRCVRTETSHAVYTCAHTSCHTWNKYLYLFIYLFYLEHELHFLDQLGHQTATKRTQVAVAVQYTTQWNIHQHTDEPLTAIPSWRRRQFPERTGALRVSLFLKSDEFKWPDGSTTLWFIYIS